MKTFKDLKIGDIIWQLNHTTLKTGKILTLGGTGKISYCIDGYGGSSSTNTTWDKIMDSTSAIGHYSSDTLYANQSEAIMELKKRLCNAMDAQVESVNAEMQKLLDIKNEIAKYL